MSFESGNTSFLLQGFEKTTTKNKKSIILKLVFGKENRKQPFWPCSSMFSAASGRTDGTNSVFRCGLSGPCLVRNSSPLQVGSGQNQLQVDVQFCFEHTGVIFTPCPTGGVILPLEILAGGGVIVPQGIFAGRNTTLGILYRRGEGGGKPSLRRRSEGGR